ncbi:MAG TPA: CNNM domain-containing protein, partial [Bacteroidales bacterium]|nr:CNNM domain-containing protein [Bacteroidales bacterium]
MKLLTGFPVLALLLFCSAMISGSEVAYFSLAPEDIEKLKISKSRRSAHVLQLLKLPDRLLSTILVVNNVVNVAIVILAAYLSTRLFNFHEYPLLGFILEVVAITFLLLFFGEILPKVYATKNHLRVALFMSNPLILLEKIFRPVASLLIRSTSVVKKRALFRHKNISMTDLSDAL